MVNNDLAIIKFGIPGLDKIFKGGVRENSSILIAGAPGTGKTILTLQFIYEGAKMGEPGIYITSEETAESLRHYAKSLGMDFEPLEKKGLIHLVEQPVLRGNIVTIDTPLKIIKKYKVKRAVLDSITLFEYEYPEKTGEFRREILRFVSAMKEAGVTLLATSEKDISNVDKIEFLPQDYIFEGLILMLRIRRSSSYERCLTVTKMRGHDHLIDIFPVTIGKGGVTVHPGEIPFSLVEKDVQKKSN